MSLWSTSVVRPTSPTTYHLPPTTSDFRLPPSAFRLPTVLISPASLGWGDDPPIPPECRHTRVLIGSRESENPERHADRVDFRLPPSASTHRTFCHRAERHLEDPVVSGAGEHVHDRLGHVLGAHHAD